MPATCFPPWPPLTLPHLTFPFPTPCLPTAAPGPSGPTDTCVGQETRSHLSMGSAACPSCSAVPVPHTRTGGDTTQENLQPPMRLGLESTASRALCFGLKLKPAPFSFHQLVHERPAPPAACDCQCPTDWLTPQNSALPLSTGVVFKIFPAEAGFVLSPRPSQAGLVAQPRECWMPAQPGSSPAGSSVP